MENNNEFDGPDFDTAEAENAYHAIMKVLNNNDARYAGGQKVFYSRADWVLRGEEYALNSEFVVVYDGGPHQQFFTTNDIEIQKALNNEGFYFEQCTGWYGAVYKL